MLCALLVVGACTGETGIIVEVSADSLTVIDSLDFVVATKHCEVDRGCVWVRDLQSGGLVDLAGRDLSVDSYSLRLNDGTDANTPSEVMVGVFGISGNLPTAFVGFDMPQPFVSGKVVRRELLLASADEPIEVDIESGCIRWITVDGEVVIGTERDYDCDGTLNIDDCGPTDPRVGPGSPEVCGNGIDDNCNGDIDENVDADLDGFKSCEGDCDDTRADINPDMDEICDAVDNNCDGSCDETFDADGDAYTTCGSKDIGGGQCAVVPQDCQPTDPLIFPGANEECDGVDNDCNGLCDEGHDGDLDGYTWCGTVDLGGGVCSRAAHDDCNDADPDINPAAGEVCDGVDTNCDGAMSIPMPCYGTRNFQPSVCQVGTATCNDTGGGSIGNCVVDAQGTVTVDFELCAAYQACVANGDPDPFTCANNAQANRTVNCTIYYGPGYTLCGERYVPLPDNGAATFCEWQILGGQQQAHYNFALRSGASLPADQLFACDAQLQLVSSLDIVHQPDTVYLTKTDDTNLGTLQQYELRIAPQSVPVCPLPGFVCNFP